MQSVTKSWLFLGITFASISLNRHDVQAQARPRRRRRFKFSRKWRRLRFWSWERPRCPRRACAFRKTETLCMRYLQKAAKSLTILNPLGLHLPQYELVLPFGNKQGIWQKFGRESNPSPRPVSHCLLQNLHILAKKNSGFVWRAHSCKDGSGSRNWVGCCRGRYIE